MTHARKDSSFLLASRILIPIVVPYDLKVVGEEILFYYLNQSGQVFF